MGEYRSGQFCCQCDLVRSRFLAEMRDRDYDCNTIQRKGFRHGQAQLILSIVALAGFVLPRLLWAAEVTSDWQRLVAAAKKEGKIG